MKTISTDTQTRIDAPAGEDPYCLLVIEGLGEILYFGDRDTTVSGVEVQGRIMEHGDVRFQTRIDSTVRTLGSFAVWSVKLSDNDERLRTLLETQGLQGATAKVYHVFEGQTLAEATLLISGKIESPPTWVEDDFSLSFDVESPRRLDQVPYAPKESEGLDIDDDAVGRPWPLVYGDAVKDVAATLVKSAPAGTLVQTIDQADMTFDVEDADEEFPQDTEITILVGDEYMKGSFSGETFTVTERQVDRYTNLAVTGNGAEITVPEGVRAVGSYIEVTDGITGILPAARSLQVAYCYKQEGRVCSMYNGASSFTVEGSYRGRVNRYPYAISSGAQWEHASGTSVTQVATGQVVYVANSIPSDAVYRVRAYRQITDSDAGTSRRALSTVPASAYTVTLNSAAYNGATILTLDEPLSARGAGWSDTLYVSHKSSVGSNPADIISDIVTRFTALSVDAASFASARARLVHDPMNFGVPRQGDALELAAEIAWQARSAVTWTGGSVKMEYLSARPSSAETVLDLDDDTLMEAGIEETRTPLENVVTVMRGLWKKNGAEEEDRKYVVENNVSNFGRREAEYQVFCYQKRVLVKRCIDFWAPRRSNIWRNVKVKTWGLEALGVDPYDHVQWKVTGFYATVPALVWGSEVGDCYTGIWAQLPIKAGETTESAEYFQDDPTSGPGTPSIATGGGEETETIEAPPPDVIAPPEFQDVVFSVEAVTNEISTASLSTFKNVRVRILSGDERTAAAAIAANNGRIGEIDILDPGGTNSTLQSERTDLVTANTEQQGIVDSETSNSEEVDAINESVSFMLIGDKGTMIKVPGGDYIVTPTNATGPFVAEVSKEPESPAEGKLYADVNVSIQGGPTETQSIEILGDGSGIEVGDKLLVFRDATGTYYSAAPGGGGGESVFRGSITGKVANQTYNCRITKADASTEDVTVSVLQIDINAILPNDTELLVLKAGDDYYAQVPLWL